MKITVTRITSDSDDTVRSITDNRILKELGGRLMEEISEWGGITARIALSPLVHTEKQGPDERPSHEWWRAVFFTPVPDEKS